jgi:hypothetical protein
LNGDWLLLVNGCLRLKYKNVSIFLLLAGPKRENVTFIDLPTFLAEYAGVPLVDLLTIDNEGLSIYVVRNPAFT